MGKVPQPTSYLEIDMLFAYLATFSLGGILIVASILLGGHDDHDVDHDVDHDHDFDHDADHNIDAEVDADGETGTWLPFLSMRFWTFFLATFGLTGTLLSVLQFPEGLGVIVSTLLGISIGWVVAWFFHRLKKSNVTGTISTQGLRGTEGLVLLSVGPEKMGRVRMLIDGQYLDLPARTQDTTTIDRKEKVLLIAVHDGIAEVTRMKMLDDHQRSTSIPSNNTTKEYS